jgi:hypothetical protein
MPIKVSQPEGLLQWCERNVDVQGPGPAVAHDSLLGKEPQDLAHHTLPLVRVEEGLRVGRSFEDE